MIDVVTPEPSDCLSNQDQDDHAAVLVVVLTATLQGNICSKFSCFFMAAFWWKYLLRNKASNFI